MNLGGLKQWAGLAGGRSPHVAVAGVPYDGSAVYRKGAALAPQRIRELSAAMPPVSEEGRLLSSLVVQDLGDLDAGADIATGWKAVADRLAAVPAGEFLTMLGGDHCTAIASLAALAERFGVDGYSAIHFDTHADTGDYEGEAPHGTPFHHAVRDGHLDGHNIVQVGLRGAWPFPEDFEWMRSVGFRWHTMGEVVERGIAAVTKDAIAHARSRAPRTYLTVDIDVLDPAFAPGTGTAEPGGLMTRELLWAVRTVASQVDLCAMDLVEVSPPYDPTGITAMAGHRVVLETLSGIALRKSGREARPERP